MGAMAVNIAETPLAQLQQLLHLLRQLLQPQLSHPQSLHPQSLQPLRQLLHPQPEQVLQLLQPPQVLPPQVLTAHTPGQAVLTGPQHPVKKRFDPEQVVQLSQSLAARTQPTVLQEPQLWQPQLWQPQLWQLPKV